MEGTGSAREREEVGRTQPWRVAAGIGVLVVLVLVGVLLIPPYLENWKLQQYVSSVAHDAASAGRPNELVRALVVDKAAELGLPVHLADVRVSRPRGGVRIEVLYVVRVDLPVYTVDLHFRPRAG